MDFRLIRKDLTLGIALFVSVPVSSRTVAKTQATMLDTAPVLRSWIVDEKRD